MKSCLTCKDQTCSFNGLETHSVCSDHRSYSRKPPFTPMYRIKKISWYKMSGKGEKQVWNGVVEKNTDKEVGFCIKEADGMFDLYFDNFEYGFLTLKAAKVGAKTLMRQKVEKWCNLVIF